MKTTTIIIGLFFALISFSGCLEDESEHCNSHLGDITIINYNKDPYNLYVDDSLFRKLNKLDTVKLVLPAKYYDFKMIQVSGYDSVPYVYQQSIGIDPCASTFWDPYDLGH